MIKYNLRGEVDIYLESFSSMVDEVFSSKGIKDVFLNNEYKKLYHLISDSYKNTHNKEFVDYINEAVKNYVYDFLNLKDFKLRYFKSDNEINIEKLNEDINFVNEVLNLHLERFLKER